MKVVVLMIVGGFLMFFSYYLSQKGYLREEEEEEANSDQNTLRSSDQTASVAQEENGEAAPVSKKKGSISLAKTLEGIDVMSIDRVEFSPTGGKPFHTQRESLKKIAVLVTTKFKKTSFSENELKPVYDYIVSNYVSELTKTDYEKIRDIFEQFVNAGGEVKLMRK